MWMFLTVLYVFGLVGTAFYVLKDEGFKDNRIMNGGFILLWPAYWTYFFLFMFLNRKGGH